LIMSLSPHWHSTLFGAYYFVGSFYTGLAALAVLSFISIKTMGLGRVIESKHFHDLGNLLLAFCLVTGDFFYSQFLVIWFGDLPNETRYVLLRVRESPWDFLAWTVLFVCFAIPFVMLLSRNFKKKPAFMMTLAVIILTGMWLERFLLVVPSLWKEGYIPLGLMELLITTGFLGVVALCVLLFLRRFPILPVSDPLFRGNV
jgi:Ni/Fe-hydrogenase subunit HybB-like protein